MFQCQRQEQNKVSQKNKHIMTNKHNHFDHKSLDSLMTISFQSEPLRGEPRIDFCM